MTGVVSARGRAERLSAYARSIVPDGANRDPNDFYPTPPGATMALCLVEQFPGTVWEPACGAFDMVRVLERASGAAHVRATDICAQRADVRGWMLADFLNPQPGDLVSADHVVTNPPFKLARPFVDRALAVVPAGGKVAMLCRLMFLEAESRHFWWRGTPLARVHVFSDRVPFQRGRLVAQGEQGGRMVPYAWFVWEKGYDGPAALGWIKYRDGVAAWDALIGRGGQG